MLSFRVSGGGGGGFGGSEVEDGAGDGEEDDVFVPDSQPTFHEVNVLLTPLPTALSPSLLIIVSHFNPLFLSLFSCPRASPCLLSILCPRFFFPPLSLHHSLPGLIQSTMQVAMAEIIARNLPSW